MGDNGSERLHESDGRAGGTRVVVEKHREPVDPGGGKVRKLTEIISTKGGWSAV
jgi:hypothetical protein